MYCEILSDKVIDISMFIKEKCVSENCNYIYSVDFNSNEYSSRWLRKRFFLIMNWLHLQTFKTMRLRI